MKFYLFGQIHLNGNDYALINSSSPGFSCFGTEMLELTTFFVDLLIICLTKFLLIQISLPEIT